MDSPNYTEAATNITCPSCGTRYGRGAKFCGKCGITLENMASVSVLAANSAGGNGQPKICPACKVAFPEYAQFCPNDARKLVLESQLQDDTVSGATTKPEASARAVQEQPPQWWGNNVIGKVIAEKYRVDALLGEGGMAQVFKATNIGLDKPVVIKLMHSSVPHMQNAVKRFEMESKVTAKLNHPNLVSVFDAGTLEPDKRPFLVMEFINGESLREKIGREGQLGFGTAANIMMQVCAGLHEAHTEGVIHRDLKPENIMLRDRADRPDWVKIVDFGIAHLKHGGQKLTGTGIAVGTVDYMSPEYLADKPIDGRADIYALGVIFYELLTGRCPFQSESAEGTMAKHLWSKAQPPSYFRQDLKPGCSFDLICERALEKEPEKRYQTTLEMRSELQKAVNNLDDCWRD